jgi:hypothetical protein
MTQSLLNYFDDSFINAGRKTVNLICWIAKNNELYINHQYSIDSNDETAFAAKNFRILCKLFKLWR